MKAWGISPIASTISTKRSVRAYGGGLSPSLSQVRYHSIVAQANSEVALDDSDDGLVPYRSAHLPGAQSEKVIISGHSVQQSAAAILEIQRILRGTWLCGKRIYSHRQLPSAVAQWVGACGATAADGKGAG